MDRFGAKGLMCHDFPVGFPLNFLAGKLKNTAAGSDYCNFLLHPWLSRIPAPVGSQEVVEHTHKLALVIQQQLQEAREVGFRSP